MVAHLFIGLIIMAFASLFITQGKRRKIWSVLLLIALCAMSWVLIQNLNSGDTSGFIYQWLPYHKLKADFNISSSLPMQNMWSTRKGFISAINIPRRVMKTS